MPIQVVIFLPYSADGSGQASLTAGVWLWHSVADRNFADQVVL